MEVIKLSHRQYLRLDKTPELAAQAANLVYVTDTAPGIARIKKGKGFAYLLGKKNVHDEEIMQRIKGLVIPPAWRQVWICPLSNGHIQATGLDARNRKQYRYHALWNILRSETKFHRLLEFGNALPQLRLQIEKDMQDKALSGQKVIATVLSLMELTYIRIGNDEYAKQNGSYGLTTMQDKHVAVNGETIRFSFTGKKGVSHDITLRNRKLARLVKECRDIPGKSLFQYYNETGERRHVDSGMVNAYIKAASGHDFTAKDFRTWAGSVHALEAFKSAGEALNEAERKRNIVHVLDEVSKKLGNTRTVCKKYYVHPGIIELYQEDNLANYLKELDAIEIPDDKTGFTKTELVLMKILKGLCKS